MILRNSYIQIKHLHDYKLVRAAKQSVSWKFASSKEEITQGSVNCLGYLMDGTRFIKNSGRKGEHLHDLLYT